MSSIFYLPAFIAIMWELLYGVMSASKTQKFIKEMKGKKLNEYNSSQKSLAMCMLLYFIWTLVGIISSQWIIFILIILISILIPKKIIFIRVIDSLVTLFLLVFMLLNKFHFHIDVWQLIKIPFLKQ